MKNIDFEAMIFDMDGVIFDSERLSQDVWVEIAAKYGIPNIEEACRRRRGTNRETGRKILMEMYGPDFPFEKYQNEVSTRFHEKYDGGFLPMKPGVVELFTALKAKGKKIALASSTRSEVVFQELGDAKLLPFFDAVVCGDMVAKSKPEPDIFLEACRRVGADPENSYGIEDSHNGIRAVAAGKLHPIMVPDMLEVTPEMEELTETILPSLLAVKEYLEL